MVDEEGVLGQQSFGQTPASVGTRFAEFPVRRDPRHQLKIWCCNGELGNSSNQTKKDGYRGGKIYTPQNTHTCIHKIIHF